MSASERPRLLHELTYSDMGEAKGLRNQRGENNCFLNSAIQILWHVDAFRRRFRRLDDHNCSDDIYGRLSGRCIFCALKVVFTQFQYSDDTSVRSDAVRKAMALTYDYEDRFQMGLMEDAAECFERILTRIHFHLNPSVDDVDCRQALCIPHQQFAIKLTEQRVCSACHDVTSDVTSVQMVYYVSAAALLSTSQRHQSTETDKGCSDFSQLLSLVLTDAEPSRCLRVECGSRSVRLRRVLKSTPEVLTVGLIWDSASPDVRHVSSVMESIDCSLHIATLFDSVQPTVEQRSVLRLVAVLSYYNAHYSTFIYHAKRRMWESVDDSHITEWA